MQDEQLLRYSRQILLPQVDITGQEKLAQARVMIVGLGGLGSPAAMYLAAAGIGHLLLNDFDQVELSNLQRQIMHQTSSLGLHKTESARRQLQALNPETQISCLPNKLNSSELQTHLRDVDVLLDCSDNFDTRFMLNAASVATGTPLISGAAIRFEGQLSVFVPNAADSPCYRCLYDENGGVAETCSENGVLAPTVGIIGSLQAMEAIKLLLGIGESLQNRLLLMDALAMEWRTLKISKDPACPVCGQH